MVRRWFVFSKEKGKSARRRVYKNANGYHTFPKIIIIISIMESAADSFNRKRDKYKVVYTQSCFGFIDFAHEQTFTDIHCFTLLLLRAVADRWKRG